MSQILSVKRSILLRIEFEKKVPICSCNIVCELIGFVIDNSHQITSNKPSEYEECILSIGSILARYCSDSKFQVFVFGGEVTSDGLHGEFFH